MLLAASDDAGVALLFPERVLCAGTKLDRFGISMKSAKADDILYI